ncbi:Protein SFK1 [Candida viswanathii]|uniref:Protein SFK1 n=1 Tax=Candida viswanathii TaxID=5486 RepID=A0A367Y0X6_9ASCO|nr:Protein SFK1 [Candida viswanathii]
MARSKPIVRFQVIHYYLIPLVALVVWWGMLIAMLAVWGAQGRPIYSFMNGEYQNPVYISDIGATNIQPLFISCSGFQAIFFVGTLVMGFYLRKVKKIQPYIDKHQPRLAIASIICAIIGQLGILFVAIFNTRDFHSVHLSMVGIFIAFCFFACVCDFAISCIFGLNPSKLDPVHDQVIFGKNRLANLYFIAFIMKLIWLCCALAFAICFGTYMRQDRDSKSAVFEWLISFWYGLLLVIWSIDLLPSAIRKYRYKHPEHYPRYQNLQDSSQWEKDIRNHGIDNNSTMSMDDHPTYVASVNPVV